MRRIREHQNGLENVLLRAKGRLHELSHTQTCMLIRRATPLYILCIIYTHTHTHREGRVLSFGVALCLNSPSTCVYMHECNKLEIVHIVLHIAFLLISARPSHFFSSGAHLRSRCVCSVLFALGMGKGPALRNQPRQKEACMNVRKTVRFKVCS